MQLVVFLDLDDTLFQTLAKCWSGAVLEPVGFHRDGRALSYMTAQQRKLFDLFTTSGRVIPTTARNYDAFQRVKLPFSDIAILDFGGAILMADGHLDTQWDQQIRPQALQARPSLERALEAILQFDSANQLGVSARIIVDFDMPLYIVVKHPAGKTGALHQIVDSGTLPFGPEWFIHHNDNNLSLVPRFLGKERAVQYVIEQHLDATNCLIFGCGDSYTDAGFLMSCDFTLVPRASQLGRRLNPLP